MQITAFVFEDGQEVPVPVAEEPPSQPPYRGQLLSGDENHD